MTPTSPDTPLPGATPRRSHSFAYGLSVAHQLLQKLAEARSELEIVTASLHVLQRGFMVDAGLVADSSGLDCLAHDGVSARQGEHLRQLLPEMRGQEGSEPVAIRDVTQHASMGDRSAVWSTEGLRGVLWIPFLTDRTRSGGAALYTRSPREWTMEDLMLARHLGLQVGYALERHRMDVELRLTLERERSAARSSMAPARRTVLLVDDDGSVRNVLRKTLELSGYRVLVASDGDEALRCFGEESHRIDILVTDAVMPRMGGTYLIEKVRRLHPHLPVILVSGYPHVRSDCPPGVRFLQKPFLPQLMAAVIRDLLSARTTSLPVASSSER